MLDNISPHISKHQSETITTEKGLRLDNMPCKGARNRILLLTSLGDDRRPEKNAEPSNRLPIIDIVGQSKIRKGLRM